MLYKRTWRSPINFFYLVFPVDVICLERLIGGWWFGSNSNGIEEATNTLPTARSTNSGISFTTGCFSKGVRQLAQIGIAPFGGCKTRAEPQQQEGQRYRGIHSTKSINIILNEWFKFSRRSTPPSAQRIDWEKQEYLRYYNSKPKTPIQ